MTSPTAQSPEYKSVRLLSQLILRPRSDTGLSILAGTSLKQELTNLSNDEFGVLLTLAESNHVVLRGLGAFLNLAREEHDARRAEWAECALRKEQKRIETAVTFVPVICKALEEHEHQVMVIKSLDHWPDFGSDLDLFTDSNPDDITKLMTRFGAQIASRSWGDRLACKWNFNIPGLPEAVEIHIGRLGQTGEQVAVASSLMKRSRQIWVSGLAFRVPSVSDRLMISTLQRMYRHFYFRLCDIVDTAGLADAGAIDYDDLRSAAAAAGIWVGVATYLAIVSDYVKQYRGTGLNLPEFVIASARFGGERVYYRRGFLRVPIMPQSARLYGSQLTGVLARGELRNGARLSLLPWLATAAAIGQKFTGSDKGIW
jgi:hypothetical protein